MLLVAGHVPHLEKPVGRIEKDAVAEHHRGRTWRGGRPDCVRIAPLPVANRGEHRVGRMISGLMELAMQPRFFDQEVVHEKLAADVDVDYGRRGRQVRRPLRDRRDAAPQRRPRTRQHDAVVKRLLRRGLRASAHRQGNTGERRCEKRSPGHAVEGPEHRQVYYRTVSNAAVTARLTISLPRLK